MSEIENLIAKLTQDRDEARRDRDAARAALVNLVKQIREAGHLGPEVNIVDQVRLNREDAMFWMVNCERLTEGRPVLTRDEWDVRKPKF